VHDVELSAFFLSKYEMTQAQWLRLTGSNPSRHAVEPDVSDQLVDGRHPVELVTWDDANDLLRKYALVLPTEAQWEYAARAGTTTPWWTGADERSLRGAANLCDLALKEYGGPSTWTYETWLDDGAPLHAPVGSFRSNAFGLHDTLGNVSEHCREYYQSPYRDSERPGDGFQDVPVGTKSRIHRGGSWKSPAERARVSRRGNLSHGTSLPDLGVRPARAVDP
jgi:formylglycine-generating enzyme required for sulfatase activity